MEVLQQGLSGCHWLQRLISRLVQSRRISSIVRQAYVCLGLGRAGTAKAQGIEVCR